MSSPPQGRALTFPIAWSQGQGQELAVPARKAAGDRSPSDEEVMARLQSNDSGALEILFGRYARLVLAIARGIVRDSGEAEDVVQEAFFYLYKKSMLFDEAKGSAKNWIIQIALHRALDRKSHLARRGFYAGTDIAVLGDILLGDTDLDRTAAFTRIHRARARGRGSSRYCAQAREACGNGPSEGSLPAVRAAQRAA